MNEETSSLQEAVGALRLLRLRTEPHEREHAIAVLKALGSQPRMAILDFLERKVANVSEIAQALDMPLSTANLHVTALEEAGLLRSEVVTASRGVQKLCAPIRRRSPSPSSGASYVDEDGDHRNADRRLLRL